MGQQQQQQQKQQQQHQQQQQQHQQQKQQQQHQQQQQQKQSKVVDSRLKKSKHQNSMKPSPKKTSRTGLRPMGKESLLTKILIDEEHERDNEEEATDTSPAPSPMRLIDYARSVNAEKLKESAMVPGVE